jgi:hypothetical protein
LVVRRIKRGDRGLEILYAFRPKGRIRPTWGFVNTVRKVAPAVFPKAFDQSWRMALATARG